MYLSIALHCTDLHCTACYLEELPDLLVRELQHVEDEEALQSDELIQGGAAAVGRPEPVDVAEAGAGILDPGGREVHPGANIKHCKPFSRLTGFSLNCIVGSQL